MNFLALDVGTSELKVTIFAASGEPLQTVRSEVTSILGLGSHREMDPEALWRGVSDAIRSLETKLKIDVAAAAISSHGETFIALDNQGRTVGNAVLNTDSRATAEMAEYEAFFGRQWLYEKTGLPAHPMYTLPKIAWLRKHRPEEFARITRFLCVEDYILYRLGISPVISASLASRTLGFDIQERRWDRELLEFAGIEQQQLSSVQNSATAVGTAAPRVANEFEIPAGVVWCAAGHDQACASIGAGALGIGTVADGTGTFECASIPLRDALVSAASMEANFPCERHVVPDHFLTLAYVPGGIALKWLRDSFLQVPGSGYDELLAGLPLEPTGIFCFPYFLGTGTPWLDSEAKAAIYGLTSTTSRQEIVQAMLEGISYEMRLNLDRLRALGVPITQVFAGGGGAKSDSWMQLKSDVFGCPLAQVSGESSSRGAAICAALAVGEYANWDDAICAMVRPGRMYEPRPAAQKRYDELFEEYKQLAHRLYAYPARGN